jgi:hypothetical protein
VNECKGGGEGKDLDEEGGVPVWQEENLTIWEAAQHVRSGHTVSVLCQKRRLFGNCRTAGNGATQRRRMSLISPGTGPTTNR